MILAHDYKENEQLRNSFDDLADLVFGIRFERWYQKGFWDNSYKCHSIVEDGVVVSNVSTSEMNLVINGQRKKAIQLGTVMTHPEFRNKGLAHKLMKIVLDKYEKEVDFFYLFPNESVMQFYPKYGFTEHYDIYYSVEAEAKPNATSSVVRIDTNNDDELRRFHKAVQSRRPVSSRFDTSGATSIYMWHCMNDLHDSIYRIPGSDNYVVFSEDEENIRLFDIVANVQYSFNHILELIGFNGQKELCLHFLPDELLEEKMKIHEKRNEDMFFRPATQSGYFSHQTMAHT